jgi:hypothetical protein
MWTEHASHKVFVVTKDVVLNQLRREGPRIGESFDELCEEDLLAIGDVVGQALTYMTPGLTAALSDQDDVLETSAILLQNAVTSTMGSLTLLREGFRLQAGTLARATVEMLAVVLHLLVNPEDLDGVIAGAIKSSKAVSTAKRVLPPFGQLYGMWSDQYVHISALHLSLQPLQAYEARDHDLELPLGALKLSAWLTYVVAELVFFDLVPGPRYWQRLDTDRMAYAPSQEERDWMTGFFGLEDEDI